MPRDEEDESQQESTPEPPKPKRPPSKGVGAPPDDSPREAELLWPWILDHLKKSGISPHQVRISIVQTMPPSATTGKAYQVGSLSGGVVAGEDPGGELVRYVTDYFHVPRQAAQGGATYNVQFSWATSSQQFKRGELTLPPVAEIVAMRREAMRLQQAEAGEAGVGAPPTPFGAPPAPPPGFAAPYPPSVYPPPPASGDVMPQMLAMMQEMWRAQLEQRPPVMPPGFVPPPGVAAPPPPPVNEDAIVAKVTAGVLGALKTLGVLDKPVAAPPPSPPPKSGLEGMLHGAFEKVISTAANEFTSSLGQTMKRAVTGAGGPPRGRRRNDDDYDDEPEPQRAPAAAGVAAPPTAPEPPPDPAEALPWRSTAVPEAKWQNGSPMVYAEDKETGGISWQGLLMSNPIVIEKGMEVGLGFVDAAKQALQRIVAPAVAGVAAPPQAPPATLPQGESKPEVVSETPAAAVDANEPSWR